jgi:dihydrofolate synthase / folylpolyglutamate synthase
MTGTELLLGLPRFADKGRDAYRPGFERIKALLHAMGDPHTAYPIAHVAGTNGKGSTASMIAAIGTASKRKVGLHTSPHLVQVTERMRIDGMSAPQTWLESRVSTYADLFTEISPSFFEATVALSLLYFAEENVDAAVVEVGLGGRLDATTVVTPAVCVITSIGLEHTDILGETIEAIASEKAGIIKPGVHVISGVEAASGARVVREVATAMGAHLIEPLHGVLPDFELDLHGAHQRRNAALAVEAARCLWKGVSDADITFALRNVRRLSGLSGRLQQVGTSPDVYADVSHNADGIAAALDALRERYAVVHIVLALMADKDVAAIAAVLRRHAASVRIIPIDGERLRCAQDLSMHLEALGVEVSGTVPAERGRIQSVATDQEDAVLATGSHLVAAEILRAFSPDSFT